MGVCRGKIAVSRSTPIKYRGECTTCGIHSVVCTVVQAMEWINYHERESKNAGSKSF
jgi:hypothetical protein